MLNEHTFPSNKHNGEIGFCSRLTQMTIRISIFFTSVSWKKTLDISTPSWVLLSRPHLVPSTFAGRINNIGIASLVKKECLKSLADAFFESWNQYDEHIVFLAFHPVAFTSYSCPQGSFFSFFFGRQNTHITQHLCCFRCSVVHNLRLKLVASRLWLRLGHGGPTCAYLVWRDCLQCLGIPSSNPVGGHPIHALPTQVVICWSEVILHGSRQPLQKLLTLTSIVSTRKTTCCGWANDGNWQLKHEAKRRLLGVWIYPWILVSFATGFAESLIMSIEHLSLSFFSLECLEQWFPRVAWIEDFPSRQISEASASHINPRSLVPHKTNNSN